MEATKAVMAQHMATLRKCTNFHFPDYHDSKKKTSTNHVLLREGRIILNNRAGHTTQSLQVLFSKAVKVFCLLLQPNTYFCFKLKASTRVFKRARLTAFSRSSIHPFSTQPLSTFPISRAEFWPRLLQSWGRPAQVPPLFTSM